MKKQQQLKKNQLNGRNDKMISVFIDGRNQQVSKRWFYEIYAVPTGKSQFECIITPPERKRQTILKQFVILKDGQKVEERLAERRIDVLSQLSKQFEPFGKPRQWSLINAKTLVVIQDGEKIIFTVLTQQEWLKVQKNPAKQQGFLYLFICLIINN